MLKAYIGHIVALLGLVTNIISLVIAFSLNTYYGIGASILILVGLIVIYIDFRKVRKNLSNTKTDLSQAQHDLSNTQTELKNSIVELESSEDELTMATRWWQKTDEKFPLKYKGIISMFGQGEAEKSLIDKIRETKISRENLRFIGFVVTTDVEEIAYELRDELSKLSITTKVRVSNGIDVEHLADTSSLLYEWMIDNDLKPNEIAVNITSGFKTMTLGIFMLAQKYNLDLIYFPSDYKKGKRIEGSGRIEIFSKD